MLLWKTDWGWEKTRQGQFFIVRLSVIFDWCIYVAQIKMKNSNKNIVTAK